MARLGRDDDHPAPAGPVGELLRQFAGQRFRRAGFERRFRAVPSSKRTSRTSRSSALLMPRSRFSAASATSSSKLASVAQRDAGFFGARDRLVRRQFGRRASPARRRGGAAWRPSRHLVRRLPRVQVFRACCEACAARRAATRRCRARVAAASGSPRRASADRRRRRCAPAPSRRRRAAGRRPSTSSMPLSSICQVRARTRIESLAAKSRPRVRSVSVSETSSAERRHDFHPGDEMGELGEVAEHHGGIGAGIVLVAQFRQARAAGRRASAPRTDR